MEHFGRKAGEGATGMVGTQRIYPRKLADGTTVYDVRFHYREPGSSQRKSRTHVAKTKREAKIWLAQQEADTSRGIALSDGTMTMGQWLDEWLAIHAPTIRPSTEYQYRNTIDNHIRPFLGDCKLKDIDARRVLRLYADLRSLGRRDSVLARVHERLDQCLERARKLRLTAYNPMADVDKPHYQPGKREVWNAAELERFLDVAAASQYGPIWRFALLTGMRNGELRGLRWCDVEASKRLIHVRQAISHAGGRRFGLPKSGHERTITVSQACIDMLLRHKAHQNETRLRYGLRWVDYDLVFSTRYGTPITLTSLRFDFLHMCERAGVRLLHIHDLRHTHASLLIAAGVEINVVSERLGHADPAITWRVYTHVLAHRHAEVAALVDTLLSASQ